MFKPMTIGYYKQVRNNPRCKAEVDLIPGMVVVIDEATKKASLPTAESAKGNIWIVSNIVDKPEVHNKEDFKVLAGEYVRADLLEDARELPIELSYKVLEDEYGDIAVGDKLVASESGKWKKADVTDGYKIVLEVFEKTTFGQAGISAVVKVDNVKVDNVKVD